MFANQLLDAQEELGSLLEENIPESIKILLNKFNDGYQTGLNWKDNYTPGGPWVYSCSREHSYRSHCSDCPEVQQSRAEHQAWMKGWRIAMAAKVDLATAISLTKDL
jgi:ribosome modulation factor